MVSRRAGSGRGGHAKGTAHSLGRALVALALFLVLYWWVQYFNETAVDHSTIDESTR